MFSSKTEEVQAEKYAVYAYSRERTLFILILAVFTLLVVWDVAFTINGLRLGLQEGNWILLKLGESIGLMNAVLFSGIFRVGLFFLLYYSYIRMPQIWLRTGMFLFVLGALIVTAGVVGQWTVVLAHHDLFLS